MKDREGSEMAESSLKKNYVRIRHYSLLFACLLGILLGNEYAIAQVDQGTITGIVQDPSGAVVPGAKVTVTNTDTGLVLNGSSNSSGVYVFSPLKIGNYTIGASASGFERTMQENIHLDAQQRLNVVISLKPGSVSETVTVTDAPPLLQTQTSSIGQVISADTISNTPLNGRNFVYIAQLTNGVVSTFNQTRGSGTGDFVANGQHAEQNNFILDGVDNNTNLVDFLNGSTYIIRPPPDALSEFSLQTSNFSAEFGHSAGGVLSASIKSGTNQIHGSLWEYVRNTSLDATDFNALTTPPYHENQFGATLGFPIIRNKLFYFGDIEANRIAFSNPGTYTVPTALERNGDFSELLNPLLNSVSTQLYRPNSGGGAANTQSFQGRNNVFDPNGLNAVAKKLIDLYPLPNVNGGKTFQNYAVNVPVHLNTIQWDQRLDWNISAHDQAYARYSYTHGITVNGLPLGPILDGSPYGGENDVNLYQSFVGSETHFFTPTLINEFRFSFTAGKSQFLQPNANVDLAPSFGLGGVPFSPNEGGLPLFIIYNNGTGNINGLSNAGSQGTSNETQNVYQILDNVTKTLGNHSLKFGVAFQSIRNFYRYAPSSLGNYYFTGLYTSDPASSATTGSGIADFLADQINTSAISTAPNVNDARWYNSAYAQDDWKLSKRLTLNLGVRYDYFLPYKENSGRQENFIPGAPLASGAGTGVLELPTSIQNTVSLGTLFPAILAKDNITVRYVNNERLVNTQSTNFAPRVGFAFQPDSKTVIRGGYGIFFGGLESNGGNNLGDNFPFRGQVNTNPVGCSLGDCPSNGTTLEGGLAGTLTNGLLNAVNQPGFHATDTQFKSPYTQNYNLSFQESISTNLAATISYVGNVSRHLGTYTDPNQVQALYPSGTNTQALQPFPDLGGIGTIHYGGVSTYNGLQTKLEKRTSHGLNFLATYTWAHAFDDSNSAGGLSSGIDARQRALLPAITEYTNSVYDVRNRVTLNGNYVLPFGRGRAYLANSNKLVDLLAGGWSSSLTFTAQSGSPFTVFPSNNGVAGTDERRAIPVRNPFAPGGTPDPSNIAAFTDSSGGLIPCPTSVKNRVNFYNPCAFANPLPVLAAGTKVTDPATAIQYLGGKSNQFYGPGNNAVNMSVFKNFTTYHEQYLQFRADSFNVLNHPTIANPTNTSDGPGGGLLNAPRIIQSNTPNSRFFQLSLRYAF